MTIEEILDDLGISHLKSGHHHARPGWLQIQRCPFCLSTNYHLGWNLQTKWCNCWRCGGHSAWQTLEALGIPRQIAFSLLAQYKHAGPAIKRERTRISTQEPAGIVPIGGPHKRYLRSRGLDPEEISQVWGVRGIALAAKLSWRLFIPITYRGVLVSWTTRAIGNRVSLRYISAPAEMAQNPKDFIYGLDYCTHTIVVVEGPVDVWKIGPGAGALLGTTFTTAQVKQLAQIPRRFICFDSSKEAQSKARELCEQLACFPGETTNLVISAKDPGEASEAELKEIRHVACLV